MTRTLTFAGGLAAALLVAVVGFNLLGSQTPPGSGGSAAPTATAAPTAATAAPTSSPSSTTRTIRPFAGRADMTVTYELPAGWGTFDGWAVGPADSGPPGGVMVAFAQAQGVHSDPCQWDVAGTGDENAPGDVAAGADALEVATAIHTNSAYTSTGAPTPVTIGSRAGHAVEIELPADLDFVGSTCDVVRGDQDGVYVVVGGTGFYPQGPSNRWRISLIDVADVQLAVIVSYFAGSPAADMTAAQRIVDSIQFSE